MGVITVTDIDYGHIFGPFPSHVTPADPAYLIGMLTNDKRPEALMLKMDPAGRREGLRAVDWLPYIQPARDSEEQNMEAYLKEGQVYFRALRIIKAGEEMLVWYSKDFAQLLDIPELPRINDGDHYICPRCGDMFEFPYPLRAHIKFKCSYTLSELSPNRAFISPERNGFRESDIARAFRLRALNHLEASKIRSSTNTRESSAKDFHNGLDFSRTENGLDFSKRAHELDFSKSGSGPTDYSKSTHGLDFSKQENGLDATLGTEQFSKTQTVSDFSKPFPRYTESRTSLSPPMKRPSEDSSPFRQAPSPKIQRVLEPKAEMLSPTKDEHSRMLSKLDRSPRKTPPETDLKDSHSDVASAFRKVERSVTPEAERPASGGSSRTEENSSLSPVISSGGVSMSMSMPTPRPPPLHAPPIGSMSRLPVPSSSAAGLPTMPGPLMGMYMPRLPMVPPPFSLPGGPVSVHVHPINAHHPAFAAADQIPPGLLEMCRASIPSIGPLTESFANIRKGDGHGLGEFPGKGLFLGPGGERGGPIAMGTVPYLKSNNPMVEKILQSTSPALMTAPIQPINMSQNWCAKCNASFRMTSDLVYHMRSHHKREFDPMKRKREEKLKCTICNETFRERHHLTRHMSSHA
ncbi:hypothetical protein V1264_012301 [Littorina saxatilis]|uniref:PR domain zinc finger protein 8 n=1 Tax=Littorina saxatilis TaxID=31220 RepID=A0AAN9BW40_9CAEN